MGKFIDLTGQRFGKLIVKKRSDFTKNKKIFWVCDCDCGNVDEIKCGQDLKRGHTTSCGHCGEKRILGTTIIDLTGKTIGRFVILGLYPERTSNRQTQWYCECQKCKEVVVAREGDLVYYQSAGCRCFNKSFGEDKIYDLLTEANIPFIRQKTFDDCRFKDTNRYAYFDFYVDNKYIIEYDGEQHFKYREEGNGWNNKVNFDRTQYCDKVKNQYCFEKNIPIIRIPYTDFKSFNLKDLKLESSKYLLKEIDYE